MILTKTDYAGLTMNNEFPNRNKNCPEDKIYLLVLNDHFSQN